MGSLHIYRIDVDGHFHGGAPVKPWVAAIEGPDSVYGLKRRFVTPLMDWENASCSWRGNIYGRKACFPLRNGCMYEVSRCRGSSSKRYVAREFFFLDGRNRLKYADDELLDWVSGGGNVTYSIPEQDDPTVHLVTGLGRITPVAFVLRDIERRYRFSEGRVYQIGDRLVTVSNGSVIKIDEKTAWELINANNISQSTS